MTIQEYIQNIQESSISESVKQEIITILKSSDVLDDEMKSKISVLIQKDIEDMLEEDTDDEAKKLFDEAQSNMSVKVTAAQEEIEHNLNEVVDEFNEIDKLTTELNSVDEEMKIKELKDKLATQA